MTLERFRRPFLAGAILCALICLADLTLLAAKTGWLAWAATPNGKDFITMMLFVAIAAPLIYVVVRDARRRRRDREEAEELAYDEWETALDIPVRAITRHEMQREADRLERECYDDALPVAVKEWRAPLFEPVPIPVPVPAFRPRTRPIAEIESYIGDAAWFASAMRAGQPVVDDHAIATAAIRAMSRPLPAVAIPTGPRHAYGYAPGTETQRLDPAFVSWERPTGAFKVLELVGSAA